MNIKRVFPGSLVKLITPYRLRVDESMTVFYTTDVFFVIAVERLFSHRTRTDTDMVGVTMLSTTSLIVTDRLTTLDLDNFVEIKK